MGNSKPLPSVLGIQYPGAAPCGTKIPVKRVFGFAAVLRNGVCAGTIESKNGRASAMPAPRRNVRLGTCFLVINNGPISPYNLEITQLLDLQKTENDSVNVRRGFRSAPASYSSGKLHSLQRPSR